MEDNILKEIAYELKVSSVMNPNVLAVSGDENIGSLREIMRDKRISGFPVVENNVLVGVISLEDFIKAIINKEQDIPIKEKMTKNPETLFEDEPLINALNKFEKFGYGRFPVIDKDKKLTGIITKTDVIHGFLKHLKDKYYEEEIKGYRVSHFFDDVLADKKEITLEYEIMGGNFKKAGDASSRLKRTIKMLGIHPDITRRLAIASYEAEMNVVIFAKKGRIKAIVFKDKIEVYVEDEGPGIEDIEKAMTPGFSTAPDWVRELGFGAGMGLGNIKNCSDFFELKSEVGLGTNLNFRINIK
ncbi:MAG: CBS domain-containing protein [bacterium]